MQHLYQRDQVPATDISVHIQQSTDTNRQNQAINKLDNILATINNFKHNQWELTEEQIQTIETINNLFSTIQPPNLTPNSNFTSQRR